MSLTDDAAPLRGEERQDCHFLGTLVKARRRSHRGCRSQDAVCRRAARFQIRRSREADPGESRHESPSHEFRLQPLHVLSCNFKSAMGKLGELRCLVEQRDIQIICIQESWLDASVEDPELPNFYVVGRRDRSHGPNRGGVITYARVDCNSIVCVKVSEHSERLWHLIQRDTGDIAFCNWYFSPSGEASELETLRTELKEMSGLAASVMIFGDLNVHHASWLRFSNGESQRGRILKEICDCYGLRQYVDRPTRGGVFVDTNKS